MRTAILLIGNLRSWRECKESFIKTFSHLNPNVFVVTYDVQYGHHPYIQKKIGDSSDVVLTKQEIIENFNNIPLKKIIIKNFVETVNSIPEPHSLFKNCGSNVPVPVFNLAQALTIMVKYEKENNFEYDLVIKTRPDLYYYEDINLECGENTMLVDSKNVFPNDWIFACKRTHMLNFVKILHEELFNPKYGDSHHSPPHTLYYNAMKHLSLDVQQREIVKYLIRKNSYKDRY